MCLHVPLSMSDAGCHVVLTSFSAASGVSLSVCLSRAHAAFPLSFLRPPPSHAARQRFLFPVSSASRTLSQARYSSPPSSFSRRRRLSPLSLSRLPADTFCSCHDSLTSSPARASPPSCARPHQKRRRIVRVCACVWCVRQCPFPPLQITRPHHAPLHNPRAQDSRIGAIVE